MRRRFTGCVILAALSLVPVGCAEPAPELPLGDELDRLLNFVAVAPHLKKSVRSCVAAQGAQITAEQLDEVLAPPEVSPISLPERPSSGLVQNALSPVEPVTEQTPKQSMPAAVAAALNQEVEYKGKIYPAGCLEYLDQLVADSDAERERKRLQDRYVDVVVDGMQSDKRWTTADAHWSDCMMEVGFGPYSTPGEQLQEIVERMQAADGDRRELERVLEFDRDVTQASLRCREESESVRAEVRNEYESIYIERYGADIENLMLLLENDA